MEEANVVLNNIKDYKITYPVAFDMGFVDNDTARIEGVSRADKTKITKAFLDTIAAAGYKTLLYGNKEWLIKEIDLSKLSAYDMVIPGGGCSGLSVSFYHVAIRGRYLGGRDCRLCQHEYQLH